MKVSTRSPLALPALLALVLTAGWPAAAHAATVVGGPHGEIVSGTPFPTTPPPGSTPPCQFRLGFATLAQLHSGMGRCIEDEHYTPEGNAEQRTQGGLMVWRKADNWTAYTDGYRTWINGPNGLEQRLNAERFPWEPDAGAPGTTLVRPPAPPAPPAAEPAPLVPGTQLGVPAASAVLEVTVLEVDRFATPAADPGKELLRVTVKLAPGTRGVGKYDWLDFRVRSREGYVFRPDSTTPKLAHGVGSGTLTAGQWVQGDLVFQVAKDASGLTLIHDWQGAGATGGVVTRRLDTLA
jgi:hypothetical protein